MEIKKLYILIFFSLDIIFITFFSIKQWEKEKKKKKHTDRY